MNEKLDYDGALKDLFQQGRPGLLRILTGGVPVREFLNVELPKVQQSRADLVLLLDDQSILHVEFQSWNDRKMPLRVASYHLLLVERHHGRRLRHVVLYAGQRRMRMSSRLDSGLMQFVYELMDLREIPADQLMESGNPADLALGLLGKDGPERLPELLAAVLRLPPAEQREAVALLVLLGGLRSLSDKLEMELNRMGLTIDISKNVILQRIRDEGVAEGRAEGRMKLLARLIRAKFGRLPRWVEDRLKTASPAQLDTWAEKILHASRIEDVVGPRPN